MKAIRATLGVVAVLTVTGCASLQVQTDYNPQASFGQLRTYDWNTRTVDPSGNPAVNSPLVEQRNRAQGETHGFHRTHLLGPLLATEAVVDDSPAGVRRVYKKEVVR